jgi:hypothetical protein
MNGFIRENEVPLPDDCSFERNKVILVARQEGIKEDVSVVYVRKHLVRR